MTEKLKTLLHERATEPDFAMPDLEALVRDGDRRVRRRGAARIAGGLAVLAVAAAIAVPQLGGGTGRDATVVAIDPGAGRSVTWATGSVIHSADGGAVDVGHPVTAYVETSSGFVVADDSGTVWSVRGQQVTEVGRTNAKHPRLVADEEGSLAGWVNTTGMGPAYLVLDQSTGETMSEGEATVRGKGGLATLAEPAYFYAIDGDTAYWRDDRGAVAVNFDSGDVRVIDANPTDSFAILDAQDGLIAFEGLSDRGASVGRTPAEARPLVESYSDMGRLSPDARYYSSDANDPHVYDVRTGQRVRFDLHDAFATGYEWLDARTLAVLAQQDDQSPVQLLTCRVPEGACEVAVADLGSFDDLSAQGFSLPVGEHTGG